MGQELRLIEVNSITFNEENEITYDIKLEDRHRFFANNILVHNCLGNYHPHSDMAAYDAIVNSANSPMPLIEGFGNFGTMTDNAAAYRYTNARLSKYSDLIFFDKFYLPVIDYVANYDGSRKEPLILPTLLPNTLLNGNFGIAPGVNTRTPSFTLLSVLKVLRQAITAGKTDAKSCLDLEFISKYGGIVHKDKDVKKEMLEFYKTGKGGFIFDSTASPLSVKNEIRIDRFAPISNIAKTLAKVEAIKGVVSTRDDGDKKDKYKMAYTITFAKNLKGSILDKVVEQVMDAFSSRLSFSVQATNRVLTEKGEAEAKLFPTTVPELINLWIEYRLELEKKACTYWIEKRKIELEDLALLRLAVKMREFILKALSKKCTDEELAAYIAKGLSITVVQANRILDLKVRQLRQLEDTKLVEKIKEIEKESAGYESRRKNPSKYVLSQLDILERAVLGK